MPLTVLSDSDIHSLLYSLSRDDVVNLQENLAEALHEYSTGTQETTGCCQSNQPQRIAIPATNNQTTLFMPASTSTSRGMKIATLATTPEPNRSGSLPSITSTISHASSASSNSANSPKTPLTAESSLSNLSISTSNRTDPSITSSQSTSPVGSLTLLTASGKPYGFLAASELTAFRTALTATMIFNRRTNVHTIAVFGAGAQALWHIRLALILRGKDIHHVHIINRNFERARQLMTNIYTSKEWEGLRNANDKLDFSIVSNEYGEYNRLLKEHVRKSDAIFCCTPSTTPLFPAEHLTSTEGRKKGRYVSAIGSYRHHMIELHPDILRQAVAAEHKHHHHKHADKGGVVVVDSLDACMKEAGEVKQAGLNPEQLVEIGELLMVKKAAMQEIERGGQGEVGLKRWLQAGNVIFKCVGLGLMDICVGEDLVMLARERGFGTTVEGF
ncbi:MAG: hypothetical protein LQ350_000643 [Teloschistes chrysophthalmus]|nr:MAG: hypothetical protein LQ350_000643 [Niorma chrysophthalma]